MKHSRVLLSMLRCAVVMAMAPTDGEASGNPNPVLAADQSAIDAVAAKVDADKAALNADEQSLADAQAKFNSDKAAVDALAAEEVAHPVVSVLVKIENLVKSSVAGIAADIVGEFDALMAEARSLIEAPLPGAAPAPEPQPAQSAPSGDGQPTATSSNDTPAAQPDTGVSSA